MGSLNINWFHLPHPMGIMEQSWKLKQMFDVVKETILKAHAAEMKK